MPKERIDKESPKLHKTILNDLHRGGFRRTLKQDLRDIYQFYLDRNTRARLSEMGWFRRYTRMFFWVIKNMILKLSPVRRILLLISLWFFLAFNSSVQSGDVQVSVNLKWIGFLILFFILMLELKDKLLAQDELAAGRFVQSAFMPGQKPKVPGWEIWLYTQPANEVGGDLVDSIQIRKDLWGIALGDVAGKGLGAALLMAKLQATLRALAPNFKTLSQLGAHMNRIFCRDGLPSRFVSLIYLEVQPNSGSLRILNAGHLPPIAMQRQRLYEMPQGSPALGILPRATYHDQHLKLNVGDWLVVYSDGLTEAQNEQGDFFGEPRFMHLLPKCYGISVQEAAEYILKQVADFIGDAKPSDDLSLILLKRQK